MAIKRFFGKLGRRKKNGSESRVSTSRADAPFPQESIRRISPRPTQPGAISASEFHSIQAHTTSPLEDKQLEASKTSRDTWTNLIAFLDLLNSPVFTPLATAIDSLGWFITAHHGVLTSQKEYQALRTQLEGLFKDLCDHFSRDTPPAMTTSILNLSEAIRTELLQVYGTQDRNTISRYVQANQDLNKVTECYRHIRGHLNRILLNTSLSIWKTLEKHTTETELRYLNMATSARYNSADAHVVQRRECTPRTRENVLLELKTWKDDRGAEKICWMSGMAGIGKTTIANTLCSILDRSHELGASFFCTRSLPECRNVKYILPTIAYQLARFSSPFRGALLQALERDPDVYTKVLQVQLNRMILGPLQAAAPSLPSNVVVVIDALDECDDGDGVEQILKVLLENASALPIKFLISSRPEHHIRARIGQSTTKRQLILHELDEKMVKADIKTYLQAELESISAIITKDQLATLAERAGALFIYAATVVRYITRGDAAERLATMLRVPSASQGSTKQTREIDRLYEAVLISAFDNKDLEDSEKGRMRQVLHTVVCAQEPLTVNAMAGLLGLAPSQVSNALKPLWSVLHLSESDPSHRVNTLHASFPDYILDSDRAKLFSCNAETHDDKLAELCFMRIGRNIPQFNICGLETSYIFDDDVPDLDKRVKQNIPLDLLYACQHWAVHLKQGGKLDDRGADLHEFLSSRLLLCMEVLNLTKRIDQVVGQMEMAICWLRAAQTSRATFLLAREARRFATTFATSPVSRSTPHLYISMLSTWPNSQSIFSQYVRRTVDLVKLRGIDNIERQLSLLSLISTPSIIHCVAYSPNGAFFAAGTNNHSVLIWDAVSCRMAIEPITGHTDVVEAIAISPDGANICSVSDDRTLRIWDPQTGRQVAGPLEGHTDGVCSVDYSPDGQWLASGSADGTVRIWGTHSWQMKGSPLHAHDGEVTSVAFSPDSSIVAAGSKSLIQLWNPLSGQSIGAPLNGHTGYIVKLAFTPDAKHLVSGSWDRTVHNWNVSTGRIEFSPLHDRLSSMGIATLSPDGSLLASAALDNTIRIWDTNTWTTRLLFRHCGIARSVKFSPDGSRIISGSLDGSIRVWELPDAADEQSIESLSAGHSSPIRSVAFSPCGTYIVSGSYDMTVCVWDAQNGQPTHNLLEGHNDWVTQVGVSADSSQIFSVSIDRMIHVWDRQTGQLGYTIGPVEADGASDSDYRECWPAIFQFDSRRVICGSKSGHIYIWDNSGLVSQMTGHRNAVYSLVSSPTGQLFVSGDDHGNLIVWDASNGEQLRGPIKAHSNYIFCAAISSDDSRVASGSADCTIRLWDVATGSPLGESLRGHTGFIRSVSFCSQGTHLVSGSNDKSIRLWEITSGQSIAVFEGHTDVVLSAAFSPNGTRIASGSADMTIRIWNAPMLVQTTTTGSDIKNHAGTSSHHTESKRTSSWTMDEHGWVYDHKHRLLLWVPPDLRSVLIRPQNTALISRQGCVELDFTGARIGDEWQTCYKPL